MKNCWEIKNCGREKGGPNASHLGICIASQQDLGHSCWAVAGTLCGGKVQGTAAKKHRLCQTCEVYKRYNRFSGTDGKRVAQELPDEEKRYRNLLFNRRRD